MTDEPLLKRLAALWMDKLDWPYEVVDGALRQLPSAIARAEPNATSVAGVFRVMPTKVGDNPLDLPQVLGSSTPVDLTVHRVLEQDRAEDAVAAEVGTGDNPRARG